MRPLLVVVRRRFDVAVAFSKRCTLYARDIYLASAREAGRASRRLFCCSGVRGSVGRRPESSAAVIS